MPPKNSFRFFRRHLILLLLLVPREEVPEQKTQVFGRYNTAKEIWDLLAQQYTSIANLAHQYQLHDSLHRMKQEPGQSINSFLSKMQGIWDQLELSKPSWTCSEDSAHFIVYRDHLRFITFLTSRTDAYESVRSSLLHQSPLPTLDNAVAELLSEETHRGLLQTRRPDIVLAAPSRPSHISSPSSALRRSSSSSFQQECCYCHELGHMVLDCPVHPCRLCCKIGTGHFPQDCPRNRAKWSKNTSSTSAPLKSGIQYRFKPPSHSAIVVDDVLNDSSFSALSDLETGQTIGINRKVGRLFKLINLSIPHRPTIPPQSAASVASQNSLELWYSRLDHVSFSRLHPLAAYKAAIKDINRDESDSEPILDATAWSDATSGLKKGALYVLGSRRKY
ncbi:hypothetical protein RJ640_018160 [Escallonia rubra]|uniref:CCHC-type domain-containing protein n=1 Tax=Escallonia rubra TaxID=112253 RepID=A0AA88S243_9ASTE|nr:hypothetical protein RJ640_018160 [Escallonia rubra]